MATHSSTLALKIPWTEELGAGYYPWGRKESAGLNNFTFTFPGSQEIASGDNSYLRAERFRDSQLRKHFRV